MIEEKPPLTRQWGWIALILLLVGGYLYLVKNPAWMGATETLSYSDFLNRLDKGELDEVTVSADQISGTLKAAAGEKPRRFTTVPVPDERLVERLNAKGVSFAGTARNTALWTLLGWVLPFLVLFWLWRSMVGRMAEGPQGGLMRAGKSKAKVYMEKDVKVTFDDVAGVEEAKEEVRELIDFLKDPTRYAQLGARAPKGILLVGPPGSGKTLMARAIAGEASVPFFSINGSEFVEMFVGLGAARVRDLFEQARANAPCLLFIDELDAVGKSRALGYLSGGAHEEMQQTLNQLLAEIDGFDPSKGIILLAATNRPEILDPALLRAGRFDRQILLDNPDLNGRAAILKVHMKKVKLASEVSAEKVAGLTPGFSGADLANLVNEAALLGTRRKAAAVEENDFVAAIERIVAGLERRKRLMNPEERRRVAYHEMGHATVALAEGELVQVQKVSIIPRGIGALGYTMQRPTEDRYLMSRGELVRKIAVLMGGRASETLFFDDVSTGAGDDLTKATNIARAMVTEYGMSGKLGLATFEVERSPFLQGATTASRRMEISEETSRIIDGEVKSILDEAYQRAAQAIERNRKFLEAGAKRLLEVETIDQKELQPLWQELGTGDDKKKPPVAVVRT
ncbi:MAG TPA: ATP-dependent zinc metalloprotease FtsH [bacterium]|nr:ATP-dependent zinc metalloprotease FtsH [bacterium]